MKRKPINSCQPQPILFGHNVQRSKGRSTGITGIRYTSVAFITVNNDMFDKHLTPNLVALALLLLGFTLPEPWGSLITSVGLFALAGALTNWLAVHMLFERVPGLYGSGVIVLHFEDFKAGILRMVHEELLGRDKVEQLLVSTAEDGDGIGGSIDLEPMLERIDLDAAFNQLVEVIKESSFGNMLAMVGGEAALQPLRDPFKQRMHGFLLEAAHSPRMQAIVSEQVASVTGSQQFTDKLERVIQARLNELTPEKIRDIMQRMIRRHLGWLVVWGGVFGGLIGLLAGLLKL